MTESALCLERRGRVHEARAHLKLAVAMQPDAEPYREALARLTAAAS